MRNLLFSFSFLIFGTLCSSLTLYQLLSVPTPLASPCANNTCCQNITCSNLGDYCPSIAYCDNCVNAYQICLSNNGTNCSCLTTAFHCLSAASQCYQQFNNYVGICQMLNHTGGFNCSACPQNKNPPISFTSCNSSLFCNSNSTCDLKHSSGACNPNLIGECGAGSSALGRSYSCQNNVGAYQCSPVQGTQLPKDLCNFPVYGNGECSGATTCTAGACVGFSQGQTCASFSDCAYGLYCSSVNFTCVLQSQQGGPCSTNDNCALGNTCFRNTCIQQFSLPVGSSCTSGSVDQCTFGSFCPQTNNANCTVAPSALISCNNNTDCNAYGTACQCTLNGQHKCGWIPYVPPICAANYRYAINCLNTYNCKALEDDPSSCAFKYCAPIVQCALNCIYGSLNSQLSPFTCPGYPSYYCSTATTVINTLLTGSPLPTSPRPPGSDAITLSVTTWLLSVLIVMLLNL